jgi:hypothetical protein
MPIFTQSFTKSTYAVGVELTEEVDQGNNRSRWAYRLFVRNVGGGAAFRSDNSATMTFKLGGTTVWDGRWSPYDFSKVAKGADLNVATGTSAWFAHGNDGALTLAVSVVADGKNTSYVGTASLSASVVAATIPRATKPTVTGSPVSINGSNALSVKCAPAVSSWTHKIVITLGSRSVTLTTGAGTTTTSYAVPAAWLDTMPNGASLNGGIKITTYSSSSQSASTQVGDVQAMAWTAQVPSTVVPKGTLALTRIDNNVPSSWGLYVRDQSGVKFAVSGVAAGAGATLTRWELTDLASGNILGSGTGASGTVTVAKISTNPAVANAGKYRLRVTDSRGRTFDSTASITITDWQPPRIVSATAVRCNTDGAANPGGNSVATKITWTISTVGGKNATKTATVKAAKRSASSWPAAQNVTSGTTLVVLSGQLAVTDEASVFWTIADQFVTVNYPSSSSTPSQGGLLVAGAQMPISFFRNSTSGQMGVAILGAPADNNCLRRVRVPGPLMLSTSPQVAHDQSNLWFDPLFLSDFWQNTDNVGVVKGTDGPNGLTVNALQVKAGGAWTSVGSVRVPASVGDSFRISAWMRKVSAGTTESFSIGGYLINSSGNWLSTQLVVSIGGTEPQGVWKQVKATLTVTRTETKFMDFCVQANGGDETWQVTDIRVVRLPPS